MGDYLDYYDLYYATPTTPATPADYTNHTEDLEHNNNDTNDGSSPAVLYNVMHRMIYVFGILGFLGLMCNVLVLVTLWQTPHKGSNSAFLFANLAFVDAFLCGLLLFPAVSGKEPWRMALNTLVCKVWQDLVIIFSVCSIFTVTSVSLDRYLGVVHPLKRCNMVKANGPFKILMTVWGLSLGVTMPVWGGILEMGLLAQESDVRVLCHVYQPVWYLITMDVLVYLLPLCVMVESYRRVSCSIRARSRMMSMGVMSTPNTTSTTMNQFRVHKGSRVSTNPNSSTRRINLEMPPRDSSGRQLVTAPSQSSSKVSELVKPSILKKSATAARADSESQRVHGQSSPESSAQPASILKSSSTYGPSTSSGARGSPASTHEGIVKQLQHLLNVTSSKHHPTPSTSHAARVLQSSSHSNYIEGLVNQLQHFLKTSATKIHPEPSTSYANRGSASASRGTRGSSVGSHAEILQKMQLRQLSSSMSGVPRPADAVSVGSSRGQYTAGQGRLSTRTMPKTDKETGPRNKVQSCLLFHAQCLAYLQCKSRPAQPGVPQQTTQYHRPSQSSIPDEYRLATASASQQQERFRPTQASTTSLGSMTSRVSFMVGGKVLPPTKTFFGAGEPREGLGGRHICSKSTVTLAFILLLFVLFWMPFFVMMPLCRLYRPGQPRGGDWQGWCMSSVMWALCHSLVNPFNYTWIRAEYRRTALRLLTFTRVKMHGGRGGGGGGAASQLSGPVSMKVPSIKLTKVRVRKVTPVPQDLCPHGSQDRGTELNAVSEIV